MSAAAATAAPAMTAGVAAALASGSTESLEFLNQIMSGLQPYLRVAVSTMVKETVEPMFKEMLPGPLASLHFTKVDIGATPVKFSRCDVETLKDSDSEKAGSLELEMDVSWDGDLDVMLDGNLLPSFGVRHVKFEGRLSVLLQPLISRLPLISAMSIALINPPELDMDFTGAANALDITLIDDSIRNIIKGGFVFYVTLVYYLSRLATDLFLLFFSLMLQTLLGAFLSFRTGSW